MIGVMPGAAYNRPDCACVEPSHEVRGEKLIQETV